MMLPRLSAAPFAALVVLCVACSSRAQTAPSSGIIPPHDQLASDALVRLALTALRELGDPQRADYRITALAMRLARRSDPTNAEMLRLEIDAWDAADERARAIEATRELVRIDPDDHVAWLRLVNHNVERLQSAEERMRAYDRLLGPEGQRLDASIRSRLALDAALLAREIGDDDRFVERLTESTTLDVTNKNAAVLYATYFSERTDDPLIRGELLGNVILADPLDPALLTNLAHELFRQRAFRGAARFFDRAEDVLVTSRISMNPEGLFDRILITWMVDGERQALDAVTSLRHQQQAFLEAERRRVEALGLDPGPKKEAHVPPIIELIRLAMGFGIKGSALGQEPLYPDAQIEPLKPETPAEQQQREARAGLTLNDLLSDSLRRSAELVEIQLDLLERREPPYDDMRDGEADELAVMTKLQLMLLRLWAGEQIEEARADLDAISDAPDQLGISDEAIQRFRGFLAVREGEALAPEDPDQAALHFERARALLAPLAESDPAASLALGILAEVEGDQSRAIRRYAQLAVREANSAIGCGARKRIDTLLGSPLPQDDRARALDEWALSFAPWLERFSDGPRRYMTLEANHLNRRIGPFERLLVRVELRNTSRRPLAYGPGATIDSQMLLSPKVTIPGRRRSQLELPEVYDLHRRLRLMPGERITADLWVNRGSVGMLLDLNATSSASIRWRVLQGYRMNESEHFTHGPMSITTETSIQERYDLSERGDASEIGDFLRQAQGDEFIEALLLCLVAGASPVPGMSPEQDLERRFSLAQAIVDRAADLSPELRAYVYAIGLRGGLLLEGSPLLEHARQETHPLAQAALLTGAFRRLADSFVKQRLQSDDPDIRELAQAVIEGAPPASAPE